MRRKIWKLLLAVSLLASMAMTAYAETSHGNPDWAVTFTSEKKMVSNFKTADLNDVILGIQPGDNVIITLALKNENNTATDWYMTNEVLYSLEDRSANAGTSGGAYTYKLAYTGPDGEEDILFDSDTVGGEGASGAGEGLRQATDALSDYFFLDTLKKGQSGKVVLEIALDGDTQGNDYQDTLADLQMNFAVEETTGPRLVPVEEGNDPSVTPVPGTPDGTQRGTGQPPKTSDESDIFPYVGLALASGIGLLAMALYSLKIRMCAESHKGVQE